MASYLEPPFNEIPDEVFMQCFSETAESEPFETFKENLIEGHITKYRVQDLRGILRVLQSDVYRDQVTICFNVNKADLVSQLHNLREHAKKRPSKPPPVPIPVIPTGTVSPYLNFASVPTSKSAGSASNSPLSPDGSLPFSPIGEAAEGSSGVVAAPLPTLTPMKKRIHIPTPPDITAATREAMGERLKGVDWTPQSAYEQLEANRQIFGHQQPQYPTVRWMGSDSIAIIRATNSSVKTRVTLTATLSSEEHSKVTNTRKRLYGLHVVCLLRRSLYPAQWPEGLGIKTAEGKVFTVPHAAWRSKDDTRDWCRVVAPVDVTAAVGCLTRTVNLSIDYTKVHQSIILALCLVESRGIAAVIEDTKTRLLETHRQDDDDDSDKTPTILPTPSQMHTARPHLSQGDEVTVDRTSVPVYDPVTMCRVQFPVKGRLCRHPGAFDLNTYIHYCCGSRVWCCPECEEPAGLASLMYDPAFQTILDADSVKNNSEAMFITLFADGSWVVKPSENEHSDPEPDTKNKKRPFSEMDQVDLVSDDSFEEDEEITNLLPPKAWGVTTPQVVSKKTPTGSASRRRRVEEEEILEPPSLSRHHPSRSALKKPRTSSSGAGTSSDNPIEL